MKKLGLSIAVFVLGAFLGASVTIAAGTSAGRGSDPARLAASAATR